MKSLKSIVPIEIQQIVQTLSSKYEVYFVGGCVRDFLLGKEIHDFDCTTNATVEEMKEVLSKYKIIETGIKHGTLTVMNHNQTVEITTFRIEKEYINHRFPTHVEFTRNLNEDLKRRDFTINALACDLNGNIIDEHKGVIDLNDKIIRCVGDPNQRFNEDALRILRAIRFSCTLGFDIEKNTKKSIINNLHLLDEISIERKRDELFKILLTVQPYTTLKEYNLFNVYHLNYHSNINKINHSFLDLYIRVAHLFHNSNTARKTLNEWHCSKSFIQDICCIIDSKDKQFNEYMIRKYIYEYGKTLTHKCLLFNQYDLTLFNKILESNELLYELAINGKDLLDLGYKGKQIKEKLDELIELVLHDLSLNKKDILINIVQK